MNVWFRVLKYEYNAWSKDYAFAENKWAFNLGFHNFFLISELRIENATWYCSILKHKLWKNIQNKKKRMTKRTSGW